MAKSDKSKSAKKRVKVGDLPTAEKTLTGKTMKRVKGGGVEPEDRTALVGDGSVRFKKGSRELSAVQKVRE